MSLAAFCGLSLLSACDRFELRKLTRRETIYRSPAQIPLEVRDEEEEELRAEKEKEQEAGGSRAPKKFPVGIDLALGHWIGKQPASESYLFQFHSYYYKDNPYGILDAYGYKTVPGSSGETYHHLWNLLATPSNSRYQAKNVQEYFGVLKTVGSKLPEELKLSLLQRMGSKLGSGYDYDFAVGNPQWSQDIPLEQIFQNARTSGDKGGICGNIHQFLREAATSLGFDSFAFSTVWRQGETSGGHIVAGYYDPKSGNVYIQNYSDVVLVGKADSPKPRMIIEAGHLFLSGFTATSMIEDANGNMHFALTTSGMMAFNGIRQAQTLSMPTRDRATVRVDIQTHRMDFAAKANLSSDGTFYAFGGYNQTQGIGMFPSFTQGFGGVGFGEKDSSTGLWGKRNLGLAGSYDSYLGVQGVTRPMALENGGTQSLRETSVFLMTKMEGKIFYIDPRTNTEYALGTEVTYGVLDMSIDKDRRSVLDGNGSDPWNWIRNYAIVSKKIAKNARLDFSVSEVRQLQFDHIQVYAPLSLAHQFATGEIDLIYTGENLYLRVGTKLYWTRGGGANLQSTLEWVNTLAKNKRVSVHAYGSGSFGKGLKDSTDPWFNLDDYETGRVGVMAEVKGKKGKSKLQFGGGIQYQGNTMTNPYDPRQMENIQEFMVNPGGPGGFAFIRLKF